MEVAAIIQLFPPKTNIPATELNTKQLSSKWTSKHEIAVVQPSKWSKLKSTNTSGSELNANCIALHCKTEQCVEPRNMDFW